MRASTRVTLVWIGVATCSVPCALSAQDWYVSTEAGRIRSALDPAAATPSVSLGLRFEDLTTGLRLTAGIPTRSDEGLWGGVGASKRLTVRGGAFTAGVDVLGNAFGLLDRSTNSLPVQTPGPFKPPSVPEAQRNGHALAGQAMPLVGFEAGRFHAQARAGVSTYSSRIGGQELDRTVSVADVQLTFMPALTVAVSPMFQRYQSGSESAANFVGTSFIAASSSGTVWAMAGMWAADSSPDPQWSAGARLRLHPNVSLEGSARHSTFDPLYLQPAQTSWSVGMSVLLGRAKIVTPPVPAAYTGGKALIRLPVSASKTTPSIAGDFNAWKPAPMQRDGNQWTFTVAVQPGVYHYAFVSSTGAWFVPESVPGRKDDGMGGHVAVLVVK